MVRYNGEDWEGYRKVFASQFQEDLIYALEGRVESARNKEELELFKKMLVAITETEDVDFLCNLKDDFFYEQYDLNFENLYDTLNYNCADEICNSQYEEFFNEKGLGA